MAKRIAVTARVSLTYEGRSVASGTPLMVSPVDAAILNRKQQITFGHPAVATRELIASADDDPPDPAAPATESSPDAEPTPRRRRYRRRDLTAESA